MVNFVYVNVHGVAPSKYVFILLFSNSLLFDLVCPYLAHIYTYGSPSTYLMFHIYILFHSLKLIDTMRVTVIEHFINTPLHLSGTCCLYHIHKYI
jgi:hypothetical protein